MSRPAKRRWNLIGGAAAVLGALALGAAGSGDEPGAAARREAPAPSAGPPRGQTAADTGAERQGEPVADPAAQPPSSKPAEPPAELAPGAAGIRVYLDPETGRVIDRPDEPGAVPQPRGLADRLNTYGGDLVQEPLPDGGFKVDLRGRFRSAVVATIDPVTDEVVIDCVPEGQNAEAGHGR